jgi:hypothetical protein
MATGLSAGGGASSTASWAVHGGSARFRGTDPLITGGSSRSLAESLGHPDTTAGKLTGSGFSALPSAAHSSTSGKLRSPPARLCSAARRGRNLAKRPAAGRTCVVGSRLDLGGHAGCSNCYGSAAAGYAHLPEGVR